MARKKPAPGPVGAPPPAGESALPAAPADDAFPIVGIGASAGGLAAFEAFFSAMPTDAESGMAFVLVQHLAPDHKSILADLVKRYTRMQVYEVEDGVKVRPNCAYIIPPNRDMALLDGSLQLLEPTTDRGVRLPIDFFFRSLAQDQRDRAICIVLSGTGTDGTLGVRAVKGEGGMAMAQDPGSTAYDGMPRSAIATGLVDCVLPPAKMPAQLAAYAAHAFGKKPRPVLLPPTPRAADTLKKICAVLRAQTGHDFSQYKENTLVRRVDRRMALHQVEQLPDYLRYLQQNPPEVEALFRDLLIGVTNFFRDPEAFATVQAQVIPRLFAGKPTGAAVRVWVAGCSTGEEAYSLAILIQEHLETLKQVFKVQVFATDIDRQAIDQARSGLFPTSIAADVSPERLGRFFSLEPGGGTYRIQKNIRDLLVFSEQNVTKDPPFSRLDLISCRNLLIYLNADLQRRLIPLFHYALAPGGVLFLGASETVGEFTALFSVLDRKGKLYLREPDAPGAARPALGDFAPPLRGEPAAAYPPRGAPRVNLREVTEQALLQHYGAAGVLINRRGELLHIYGRTGRYLEPAPGEAGLSLLPMCREGLQRPLATALHRAVTGKEPVRYAGVRVRTNGDTVTANLTVRPVAGSPGQADEPDLLLIIFEEAPPPEPAPTGATLDSAAEAASDADQRIATLEQELRAKEEYLQTTLEEMETSNEELRSTNEEMQSVNEELQSTNEELETSKEELQSVNEELATVNAELQTKVTDLTRLNNDMNNLLAGTGVGTLFVDLGLRIARFTPAATQVIHLIPTDVGRPLGHVVSNLVGYDRLVADTQAVLESLVPFEAEVQTAAGAWHLMRIRPYRTLENAIEGAVLTFVDISDRKRMEEEIRSLNAELSQRIAERTAELSAANEQLQSRLAEINSYYDHAPVGLAVLDADLCFVRINHLLAEINGLPADQHVGKAVEEVVPSLDEQARRVAAEIRRTGRPVTEEFSGETAAQPGVRRTWLESWHPLRGEGGAAGFTVIVQDITERKRAEEALRHSEQLLAADLAAMTRLHRIGALFIGEGNLEPVLDEIVEAAMAITDADRGNLQLFDPASGDLKIRAQRGFEPDWVAFWNEAYTGQGACHVALARGERVIVEDVAASSIFAGTPALEVQLRAGVRAVQSTPVVSRAGRPLGMLSTHFGAPGRPGERALQLVDLLARQTADILERAQLEKALGPGAVSERGEP